MREFGYNDRSDDREDEVYSKPVKAGRRTYFFDVKSTRGGDYFLTITESRKSTDRDGNASYDKHKIFLYKEDFAKFAEGFEEVVNYVKKAKPEFFEQEATAAASVDDEFDKL